LRRDRKRPSESCWPSRSPGTKVRLWGKEIRRGAAIKNKKSQAKIAGGVAQERDSSPPNIASIELNRLITELQIHREELRAQNDELRAVQEELQSERDRFSDLYENAPIGYLTLDASDHVIEANQDAAQLLGFPKKDIINRRFSIFVKDYDRAAFRAFFNEILVNQQREIRELRLSTPSGDIVAQLSGISTRGKKKALTHVRIAILDITRLREAETRARPSEEMYRELFESVLEGIAIVDENEIIQMCNPALAKIYDADDPAELVGRNVLDFSPGPEGQVILGQTALRKQNISSKYELGIVTLKGRRKTIRVSATPWFDEKGKYRGSLGNIIDITERKAMERELAKGRQRLELALYGGGLGLWDWNLVSGEVESNEL
jgi:PAS domain S-box-containing protein